jgi:hypothetical protein
VIFIFPKRGIHELGPCTYSREQMEPQPLLIYENLPGKYADAFDGFYAWISPGDKGWAPDGSNWGDEYLSNFYQTMGSKYSGQDHRRRSVGWIQ